MVMGLACFGDFVSFARFGRFGYFGGFVSVVSAVSLVSLVSFRWFRFVVSGFSTCHFLRHNYAGSIITTVEHNLEHNSSF